MREEGGGAGLTRAGGSEFTAGTLCPRYGGGGGGGTSRVPLRELDGGSWGADLRPGGSRAGGGGRAPRPDGILDGGGGGGP